MAKDVLESLCRHLIGLGWYEGQVKDDGQFSAEPMFCGASGFVLQLHDDLPASCALITAGHVFADSEQRLSDPKMAARNHSLFDVWGPHARCDHRIPFDFFDTPAFVSFDKKVGVDFAVVPLPELIRRLIAQTTVPFTKNNWIHQSEVSSFDFFVMLGLPNEDMQQVTNKKEGIASITTFQNPALLFLEPCELPSGITPASNPQFVARIDPRADLGNIVGMSGGPIFGFRKSADGQLAYWPVAIQSRWLPKRRIVIGTYLPPIAASIEQEIENLLAQDPT